MKRVMILAAIVVVAFLVTMPRPSNPTDTANEQVDPIISSNEAVTRSLALFPVHITPTAQTASLVSRESFEYWSVYGNDSSLIPPEATPDWGDVDPDSPIWLVGILGSDLDTQDVLVEPLGIEIGDTRTVDGAYYAWDATSGRLLESGGFLPGNASNYASLQAVPTIMVKIVSATPFPTESDSRTLGPTHTWEPSALSTAVYLVTQQAIQALTVTPTP